MSRFHGVADEGDSDIAMSLFVAILPFVWTPRPPAPTRSDMGRGASSPPANRLAPGNRRAKLAGAPIGSSRHGHGIPPVLARVWRGPVELSVNLSTPRYDSIRASRAIRVRFLTMP